MAAVLTPFRTQTLRNKMFFAATSPSTACCSIRRRLTESAEVSVRAVLDFVGGIEDLQTGIIRAIGDPARRFAEDKLRMLRAVRFAARFGFCDRRQHVAAIRAGAPEIDQVSQRTRAGRTDPHADGRCCTTSL